MVSPCFYTDPVFDKKGNFHPTFRPGSEVNLIANSVILAVGQGSTLSTIVGTEKIEESSEGKIQIDENMTSNLPWVFAGGDIAGMGQNAVQAIIDGQKAARRDE